MLMVRFSPAALNFGYDFVLLVYFFGTPCICLEFVYICTKLKLYFYINLCTYIFKERI